VRRVDPGQADVAVDDQSVRLDEEIYQNRYAFELD
jgi:hypothetical protein